MIELYSWDIRINGIYKSKRIDMKGLNIYIKDITKQVFLKDLGFTYLQYLQTNSSPPIPQNCWDIPISEIYKSKI